MKVKLLKKVRRRFEIVHCPKGIYYGGTHYNYNLFKLIDNSYGEGCDTWVQLGIDNKVKRYTDNVFDTEKECINFLKSAIIFRLRSEGHIGCKDKKIIKLQNKIWYK